MRDHNGIMASNISQVQPPILRERGLLWRGGTSTASRTVSECIVTKVQLQPAINSFFESPLYDLHL